MPERRPSLDLRRGAAVWCLAAIALVVCAPVARADTSTATGQAAAIGVSGVVTADTGAAAAGNDGSRPPVLDAQTPALSVLGSQNLITAGTLVQQAEAGPDGTSAACAGLVGGGGSITIGPGGCTVTAGSTVAQLRLSATVTIRAAAVLASCTATSAGTTTTTVQLVNAGVYVSGVLATSLSSSPAANSTVTVAGVATLTLHTTSVPAGAGSVRARALQVVVDASAADLWIGDVRCGPNAVAPPTPATATEVATVLPVALLAAVLLGASAGRRRPGRRPGRQNRAAG